MLKYHLALWNMELDILIANNKVLYKEQEKESESLFSFAFIIVDLLKYMSGLPKRNVVIYGCYQLLLC